MIFLSNPSALTIDGTVLDPTVTAVPLGAGWNMVSFLRFIQLDVQTAAEGVSANLVLIKDGDGQVYWPEFDINSIGNMLPGKGYQVYMGGADNLYYLQN